MSRIRTIKPEFWTSEQVVECSVNARLLFIGFWSFADDNGVLPASAKHVKMLVYPGDDFTVAQVQGFVDELLHQGLLAEFVGDDGRAYWFVTGWKKHQRIDKPSNKYPSPHLNTKSSSTAPQPIADRSATIRQPFAEPSATVRQPFAEPSPTERSVVERKGEEGKGNGVYVERASASENPKPDTHTPVPQSPSLIDGFPADFIRAMQAYPKRSGGNPQVQAFRAWNTLIKEGHTAAEILAGVERYARWCRETGKVDTEFVKTAAKFFGPDKPFLDPWDSPAAQGRSGPPPASKANNIRAQSAAAIAEWLARDTTLEGGAVHAAH